MVIFQCQPPATYWRESPRTPGKCWDDKVVLGMDMTASLINCIGDWTFGILPLFVVRGLNMRKRTRLLVMCLLSFAAIGSIATVVRMFYLPKLLTGDDYLCKIFHSLSTAPLTRKIDNSVEVAMLSTIESGIGITAVSLMTLQPLWDHWRGRIGTSSNFSSSMSGPNPGNKPRSAYIKANGSDGNRPLSLRPDNVMSISRASGPMNSTTSSTLKSRSSPERIPLADRTSAPGIIRTREVTQSRLDLSQIDDLSQSITQTPPVKGEQAGIPTSEYEPVKNRMSLSNKQNDNASLQLGSPRLPFFSPLPSLLSIFNQSKRKSAASSQLRANTGPTTRSAIQPDAFEGSRATGMLKEENHSQVQLNQP
jgi:hypothetical protein